MYKIFRVLWPSFLVAAVAEGIFFTVIDPRELYLFGEVVHLSKTATYSIGFFGFWAMCAASSLLTGLLLAGAADINRGVGAAPKTGDDCPP